MLLNLFILISLFTDKLPTTQADRQRSFYVTQPTIIMLPSVVMYLMINKYVVGRRDKMYWRQARVTGRMLPALEQH